MRSTITERGQTVIPAAIRRKLALQQCLALPMQWIEYSEELLLQVAELKAGNSLSVADVWIAAAAMTQDAILVHKDPEFASLPLPQAPLPFKST